MGSAATRVRPVRRARAGPTQLRTRCEVITTTAGAALPLLLGFLASAVAAASSDFTTNPRDGEGSRVVQEGGLCSFSRRGNQGRGRAHKPVWPPAACQARVLISPGQAVGRSGLRAWVRRTLLASPPTTIPPAATGVEQTFAFPRPRAHQQGEPPPTVRAVNGTEALLAWMQALGVAPPPGWRTVSLRVLQPAGCLIE